MPGSIHSPLAKGCHRLIKQGAKLAESAEDILEELRLPVVRPDESVAEKVAAPAHPVLGHLGFDPCDFDTLAARADMSAETLAALLTEWELEGLIESLPGGRYQRVR